MDIKIVKSTLISWLLLLSFCIPHSVTYGAGIAVPTVAALIAKTAVNMVTYQFTSSFEFAANKQIKIVEKAKQPQPSSDTTLSEIKEADQSLIALLGVGTVFLVIVALSIAMSKQSQPVDKTDAHELKAEKA